MAINDVVADGLGFNAGQLGWLLTEGIGAFTDAPASVVLSGTVTPSCSETDIRVGGKTIILTLTGSTWITA